MSRRPLDSSVPAIAVHDVSKRYGRTIALDHVDLEVAAGEFVVLTGPSGAGKSTLLNLLAALEKPDTGTIFVRGHRLGRRSRHLNRLRRVEVGHGAEHLHLPACTLDAVTRVLIDSTDGERTWTTIGVSANIIEASWMALIDSFVYGLLHAP